MRRASLKLPHVEPVDQLPAGSESRCGLDELSSLLPAVPPDRRTGKPRAMSLFSVASIAYSSLFFLMVLLASCQKATPLEFSGKTMGTSYAIRVSSLPHGDELRSFVELVDDELESIEQSISTYREDSELSRFNTQQSLDWIEVSLPLAQIVVHAQEISKLSDGAFDITMGPLVELWGFGSRKSTLKPPTVEQIAKASTRVGYRHLQSRLAPPALRKLRADLSLDLSAMAKGYAVDRIAELLNARGLENYLIEIGGEIRARGRKAPGKAWRVGIEQPRAQNRSVNRVLKLRDLAVATSGNDRNYFTAEQNRYGHIIDPRSGKPTSHGLASVTVLAKDCSTADAWATALAVAGAKEGLRIANELGIQAFFIYVQGDRFLTSGSQAFEAQFGSQ